jgi:hypothetical protein
MLAAGFFSGNGNGSGACTRSGRTFGCLSWPSLSSTEWISASRPASVASAASKIIEGVGRVRVVKVAELRKKFWGNFVQGRTQRLKNMTVDDLFSLRGGMGGHLIQSVVEGFLQ